MTELHEGEFSELGFQRGIVIEVDIDGPLFKVLYENFGMRALDAKLPVTRFDDPHELLEAVVNYPNVGTDAVFETATAQLDWFEEPDRRKVVRGALIHCHSMRFRTDTIIAEAPPALGDLSSAVYCVEPRRVPPEQVDSFLLRQADDLYAKLEERFRAENP